MALTLTLDHSVNQLSEPGYWQFMSARQIAEAGDTEDGTSPKGIWWDAPTGTLMLRPLQFDPTWINTSQQHDSIIHIDQMNVAAADLAARTIFQAPVHGNNDNPYIHHVPVGASSAFIDPGSAPTVAGIATSLLATTLDDIIRVTNQLFQPSTTVHPSTDTVTPVSAGTTTAGKFLVETQRMDANQAIFLRWWTPSGLLGFPCTYGFFIGEYCLRIKGAVVEVFKDISASGTRNQWKKIRQAPLFSPGDTANTGRVFPNAGMGSDSGHDRQLLFLPYRGNEILLLASTGKALTFQVNNKAKRNADNTDWQITRADNVVVWCQTPAPGRFQIQKVKYFHATGANPVVVRVPPITLEYTPAVPPTLTASTSTDYGTAIATTFSTPPAYELASNDASTCPTTTTTATSQRTTYGAEFKLAGSSDDRKTPELYGIEVIAQRTFIASLATPTTVNNTRLASAHLSTGLDPGQGRLQAVVMDKTPYPLTPYYYRASFLIALKDGSTYLFQGLTAPIEVTPIHGNTGMDWRLTFSALDRWQALLDTNLRDQRDWTGYGHIDVVKFITEQAGIDCTSAEFPAAYTANVINTTNSALGGDYVPVKQKSRNLKPAWQPRITDTAASFVQRVRDLYSDWYMGFRLDGTFFYLPRTYFTSPTVTFAPVSSGTPPFFYDTVTFTTIQPEANIVSAMCGDEEKGSIVLSPPWVDYQSLRNPAAVNYLGRPKPRIVKVGGTMSCPQLSWVARKVWERARRRRITVSFEAEFVPTLGVGHVCTLGSYGNYRVTGFTADLKHTNDSRATYTAELLESGVQIA